jgi:predicted CXXCH cytochrome family protein
MSLFMRLTSVRGLSIIGAVAPALLLLAAGCRTPAARSPLPSIPTTAAEFAPYAGDAACAECHSAEFTLHRGSRHAVTLRRADPASLGPLAPPAGPIPHAAYAITEQAGSLRFTRNDPPAASAAIQYAFGSGKTVMTYVGEVGANRLTEFGMSYRPSAKAWCVTPGQEQRTGLKLGVVNELGRARKCVLCHAVKVETGSDAPAPGFLGVGCESCHGPGGPHIAAVRTPKVVDIKMEKMSAWGAVRIDALCARCHRSADDLSPGALEANSTARFQPYGLEMSPCFKKSGGRLSCITCHNPHTDAETDRHFYEKICLSCHSPAASAHNRVCPVNPREQCIGCHMPKEQVFAAANIPITMADHLIWAYRPHR